MARCAFPECGAPCKGEWCYLHEDSPSSAPSDDEAPDAPPSEAITRVKERMELRLVKPGELAPPKPLPFEEQPDEDIRAFALPAPVRELCQEIRRIRGGPLALSASMACGVLAALVQGKVQYRVSPLWKEQACIYWLVFTPPSAGKSTTTKPILAPLAAFEAEQERTIEAGRHYATARRKGLEARMAQLGKTAARCEENRADPELDDNGEPAWGQRIDPGGPTEAKLEMKKLARELERCPVPLVPRLTRTDINPQMLTKRMAHNQKAMGTDYATLAILSSEPAFLSNLQGRHSHGVPILETVLSAYDGEAIGEDRAGEHSGVIIDSTIRKPLLSIVCQGQPDVLEGLLEVEALRSRGFWSRCIVHNLQDTTPWSISDECLHPDIEARWNSTVRALATWRPNGCTEVDLAFLRPTMDKLYSEAEKRCKGHPEQTARARRAMVKALRLIGLGVVCERLASPDGLSERADCQMSPNPLSRAMWVDVLEYLYTSFYPPVRTGLGPETGTGPRTDPQGERQRGRGVQALLTMRHHRQSFGPGITWATRELQRTMTKDAEWVASACEELEEAGYIEHDPKSMRKYRGQLSPKKYKTINLGEDSPVPQTAQLREPGED